MEIAVRNRVEAALESGRWADSWSARVLAYGWASIAARRGVIRPGRIPSSVSRTYCVGGATLGGSGKTRVALAIAKASLLAGKTTVLIGHGYRGGWGEAQVVRPDSKLSEVGDEALLCARALPHVVIGPSRQSAIDLAVAYFRPDVLVLDGPLRLRDGGPNQPNQRSILAVDAHAPWGSGAVPPRGDLRAPRAVLEAVADHVVSVDASSPELVQLRDRRRVGLFTVIGRPQRLRAALERAGVVIAKAVHVPDHGPVSPKALASLEDDSVDVWVMTEKCALHLEDSKSTVPRLVLASSCAVSLEELQRFGTTICDI